jgi:hypothetical protein
VIAVALFIMMWTRRFADSEPAHTGPAVRSEL